MFTCVVSDLDETELFISEKVNSKALAFRSVENIICKMEENLKEASQDELSSVASHWPQYYSHVADWEWTCSACELRRLI